MFCSFPYFAGGVDFKGLLALFLKSVAYFCAYFLNFLQGYLIVFSGVFSNRVLPRNGRFLICETEIVQSQFWIAFSETALTSY